MKEQNLLATHPCFNAHACRVFGRIHLPVAPRCNIRCHYCLPAFDCPNESRPGVTSKILSPQEAISRVRYALERIPTINVIGIAGPGDSMCNAQTFETLALVRERYPDLALCLSTNGLSLPEKLEELKRLGVKFWTITVNAVDAEVGGKIYAWVVWERRKLEGCEGARVLIAQQWQAMEEAAKMGFFIKVNTVMIPGINTDQIPEIAQQARRAGAHIHNIMPLIPVTGTKFAGTHPPSDSDRRHMQGRCGEFIPQMLHCSHCRADAVGLLGDDQGLGHLSKRKAGHYSSSGTEVYAPMKVAVASSHEGLIDLHFGHAREFTIYQINRNGNPTLLEQRPVRPYCFGPEECQTGEDYLKGIIEHLSDCKVLFCVRIGWEPSRRLKEADIEVVATHGLIEVAVRRFLREKRGDEERPTMKNGQVEEHGKQLY